jgi:hypothetical protein
MGGKIILEPNFMHESCLAPAGALTGVADGASEASWIALYQNLAGKENAALLAGVTQSVIPNRFGRNI